MDGSDCRLTLMGPLQVDAQVSDALRHAVKRTLAELAAALHGTRRLEVSTCSGLRLKGTLRAEPNVADAARKQVVVQADSLGDQIWVWVQ